MKAITVLATGIILLTTAVHAQSPEPQVVATGSDGAYATFVVVQKNGTVKACRMSISGYGSPPDCHIVSQ